MTQPYSRAGLVAASQVVRGPAAATSSRRSDRGLLLAGSTSSCPSGISDSSDLRTSSMSDRLSTSRSVGVCIGDRRSRLIAENAVEHAAVRQDDGRHPIRGGHQGRRIDDVFQQVVEVRPLGAGQIGTDFAPLAEQRMARGTGLREPAAAVGPVGRREGLRRSARFSDWSIRLRFVAEIDLELGPECGHLRGGCRRPEKSTSAGPETREPGRGRFFPIGWRPTAGGPRPAVNSA